MIFGKISRNYGTKDYLLKVDKSQKEKGGCALVKL